MKIKFLRLYQAVKLNNRLETSLEAGRAANLGRGGMDSLEMRFMDNMVFVYDRTSQDALVIGMSNIAEMRPLNLDEFKAKMGIGIKKATTSPSPAKKKSSAKKKSVSELDELD